MTTDHTHDPLQPHRHDPNPTPPSDDPTLTLTLPNGQQRRMGLADLQALPETTVSECYIVSTGHGTSGPFTFGGVTLLAFIKAVLDDETIWSQVEVISADGFGNRVQATEVYQPDAVGPILLSYKLDGELLSREAGLVRMIVPNESDDALRQVKWVAQIRILP